MDVLLLEDDRLDAEMVDIVLRRGRQTSVRIVHVTTLDEALSELEQNRFDAALVDLNLPDAVGAEAVERIVLARHRLPVVVLSGNGDEEFAISLIRAGAQDFVVKGSDELGGLYRTVRYAIERKAAELRLRHLASYDTLTKLANRQELYHQLEKACAHADRHGDMAVLLLFDLDRFKLVNDIHGHHAGDDVLRMFAKRLRENIRKGDTAARLGGDEFAVVLEGIPSLEKAMEWARRALAAINEPLAVKGVSFPVSASIGGAVYPTHGADVDALVRSADIAMYKVKRTGRNGVAFYDEHMDRRLVRQQELESEVRAALENGQIQPFLQPKVDIATRRVIGFEALCRWVRADGEVIAPGEFLPIIRACGLIQQLGETMRRQVLDYLSKQTEPLPVSINVDALELASKGFARAFIRDVQCAGVSGSAVSIEITETALLESDAETGRNLAAFRDHGIALELDDFGAGHSSLNYLRHFRVDALKVDRALVIGLGDDEQSRVILRAVIQLARELGLKITAEGIETAVQLHTLANMCCETGQGYLFARPMPLASVGEWLREYGQSLTERLDVMTGSFAVPLELRVERAADGS
ncbi:MAG: EAL domain-containing protein [Pseudomonadota bacterium]